METPQSPSQELLLTDVQQRALRLMNLMPYLVEHCIARWAPILFPAAQQKLQELPLGCGGEGGEALLWALATVCCTQRLDDGTVPVASFAATAPGLSDDERATIHGWTGLREGPFDVLRAAHPRVMVVPFGHNRPVLDLMTIVEPEFCRLLRAGCLLMTNLLPVEDFYITVGPLQITPHQDRTEILRCLGLDKPKRSQRRTRH